MTWRLQTDDSSGRTRLQRYLTAQDLSELFQVPRRTIYAYVDSGALECLRVGPRLLRFSEDQVRAFLDRDEDVAS